MFRMCDLKYFATHFVMFFECRERGKTLVEPKELSLRVVPFFSIVACVSNYIEYDDDAVWFGNITVEVPVRV